MLHDICFTFLKMVYRGAVKSLARPTTLCILSNGENISFDASLIIIIGIEPLGLFGQRPELSHVTGVALVCCILGKFLGVVCHCFPPRLDVPTFATRFRHDARYINSINIPPIMIINMIY